MDEELAIINSNTRNEKIKNFFVNNKKPLIISVFIIILLVFSYFIYKEYDKKNKIKLANNYDTAVNNFISGDKSKVKNQLIDIVESEDETYSPLSLYFLIDNNILGDFPNKYVAGSKEGFPEYEVNRLFDIVIYNSGLKEEIKNLVIYKKALLFSEFCSEDRLIVILKPLINSKSIWKSHALYLSAEYYYSRNEKQKSKEFFNEILTLENGNSNLKAASRKRLSRDFSE